VSLAHQALTQFIAESRNSSLDETESRTILRRVLAIPSEQAVSLQRDPTRRLHMLSQLNASNECLRRHRAALGPNAHAVLNAIAELSQSIQEPTPCRVSSK